MKILISCEYSGRMRDAIAAHGHTAVSCDLRPSETPGLHIQRDVLEVLRGEWESFDAMVAHPYALSGVQWLYHPEDTPLPSSERRRHPRYPTRMIDFLEGVEFFKAHQESKIPVKIIENSQPHGLAMNHLGRYSQILQPWMLGSPFTKGAYLWLEGIGPVPTTHKKSDYLAGEIKAACHLMAPGPDREKERSRTDPAIAIAQHLHNRLTGVE
jgi:hypothetical protein